MIKLIQGDCLEKMKDIPDNSVDMVLADLPYGTTACKWDSVISLSELWKVYKRVCSINAVLAFTACDPFTHYLAASNLGAYKYSWFWNKEKGGNFATVKKQPIRTVETILIFSFGSGTYNPQMTEALVENKRPRGSFTSQKQGNMFAKTPIGGFQVSKNHNEEKRFPKTLISSFPSTVGELNNTNRIHPTQKPVALMEYLIRTYTNEGDTVLDNTMGSGTTGVACINTNRKFIGIEKDETYFAIAEKRIREAELNSL